jgi:hypothetical protein
MQRLIVRREAWGLSALVGALPRRGAEVWMIGCSTGDELYLPCY